MKRASKKDDEDMDPNPGPNRHAKAIDHLSVDVLNLRLGLALLPHIVQEAVFIVDGEVIFLVVGRILREEAGGIATHYVVPVHVLIRIVGGIIVLSCNEIVSMRDTSGSREGADLQFSFSSSSGNSSSLSPSSP